jgi:hypothetical protein
VQVRQVFPSILKKGQHMSAVNMGWGGGNILDFGQSIGQGLSQTIGQGVNNVTSLLFGGLNSGINYAGQSMNTLMAGAGNLFQGFMPQMPQMGCGNMNPFGMPMPMPGQGMQGMGMNPMMPGFGMQQGMCMNPLTTMMPGLGLQQGMGMDPMTMMMQGFQGANPMAGNPMGGMDPSMGGGMDSLSQLSQMMSGGLSGPGDEDSGEE